jgi:hypothetical protein
MNQKPPRPTNVPQPENQENSEEGLEDNEEGGSRFLLFNVMPSWLVSFLSHIAVIIILAVIIMPPQKDRVVALQAGEQAAQPLESFEMNFDTLDFNAEEAVEQEFSEQETTEVTEMVDTALPEAEVDFGNILGAEEVALESKMLGALEAADMSSETSSRSGNSKGQLLKEYGGNSASEESVALALKWIIKHQLPDGGWSLDHTMGPGNFRDSPDPGNLPQARGAATALAILPLLGAGHTHQTGEYKDEVRRGLKFLMYRAKRAQRGLSYLEPGGSMYSHGLVSIAICEAYAMTKDPELVNYAQGTLWYIEQAQDPVGGGWRYQPRQPGDTSAVGWQLMALKSGKISGLAIQHKTYKLVEKFLDSVSTSGGAFYGYAGPPVGTPANACTAVGLLCRMYMGWDKEVPGLNRGIEALAERGPSMASKNSADMYYNYYATQAMKHIGGKKWKNWNTKMRDFLVKSQETEGNMAGSWHFDNGHAADRGGRLYSTSLACMTLEVYYRYLPLYGDKAANDEFPLD